MAVRTFAESQTENGPAPAGQQKKNRCDSRQPAWEEPMNRSNDRVDIPAAVVCLAVCVPFLGVAAWLVWRVVDSFQASEKSKILIWVVCMFGVETAAMLSFEALCEAISKLAGIVRGWWKSVRSVNGRRTRSARLRP
jgi:hypothetical protein